MNRYLLSIDQRTIGSTAMVMGMDGRTLGRESEELLPHFRAPAWVEHDPSEIRAAATQAVTGGLRAAGVAGCESAPSGMLRPRTTTRAGHQVSGRPMDRARAWQDRRSTEGSLRWGLAHFRKARSVPSSDEVAFVRASSDVGAPHWDLAPERRAADVLAEMPPEPGRSAKEGTRSAAFELTEAPLRTIFSCSFKAMCSK